MTTDKAKLDPVFLNARREALFILVVFAVCFLWSILVCYFDGYVTAGNITANVPIVWGMPRWVFWGIFMPWVFADVVTIGFVFFFMRDDDLGETADDEA